MLGYATLVRPSPSRSDGAAQPARLTRALAMAKTGNLDRIGSSLCSAD
jgi:hypothetical protein